MVHSPGRGSGRVLRSSVSLCQGVPVATVEDSCRGTFPVGIVHSQNHPRGTKTTVKTRGRDLQMSQKPRKPHPGLPSRFQRWGWVAVAHLYLPSSFGGDVAADFCPDPHSHGLGAGTATCLCVWHHPFVQQHRPSALCRAFGRCWPRSACAAGRDQAPSATRADPARSSGKHPETCWLCKCNPRSPRAGYPVPPVGSGLPTEMLPRYAKEMIKCTSSC